VTTRYWRRSPDAPLATLLRVIERHCHPEADEDAYPALRRLAHREGDPEMDRFKQELREVVGDPAKVSDGALFQAAEYSDGSDEKFLRRLWRDLYGDEVP
jgi:hypothetical protein